MTLAEIQQANDDLRCRFKGGRVLMTTSLQAELAPELRGRMLYRLACTRFR